MIKVFLFINLLIPLSLFANQSTYDFVQCNRILSSLTRAELRAGYTDTLKYYQNNNHRVLKELTERKEQGDQHVQNLIRLGFKIKQVDGEVLLYPPVSFEDIFSNYETFMRLKLKQTQTWHALNKEFPELREEDVIWPSIVFIKKDVKPYMAKPEDFYLMRYGLDLEPDLSKYTLLNSTMHGFEFSEDIFITFLAQGKMPLEIRYSSYHEFAHLTEFMERPFLMKEIKAAAKRFVDLNIENPDHETHIKIEKLKERLYWLLEFMIVPKLENESFIKKEFGFLFDSQFKFKQDLNNYLSLKSEHDLIQLALRVLNLENYLFYRMGGIQRDLLRSRGASDSNVNQGHIQLTKIENLVKKPELTNRELIELRTQLTGILWIIREGIKYKITPEKLYKELIIPQPSQESDSVKYFFNALGPKADLSLFFVAPE